MALKPFFKRHSKLVFFVLAVLISVVVYIFRGYFVRLQGLGLFGLFIFSILGNATIILPVPVILTAFLGGAIFNPILVAVIVSFGATIGELTGYMAGYGGREVVEKDVRIQKVEKWMQRWGLWALFILAVIPNPIFDLAGMVAGATKIPVYKYFPIVWAGKLIKFGIFALLGAGSISLIDKFV